jgi:hypothetical protein
MKLKVLSPKTIKLNFFKTLHLWLISKVFNRPQGWHYYLDQIAIMDILNDAPAHKILDAGAGLGIIQYVLALKGHTVYSLDYSNRIFPWYYRLFVKFSVIDNEGFDYKHSYQSFIRYRVGFTEKIRKLLNPIAVFMKVYNSVLTLLCVIVYFLLRLLSFKKRGQINLIRASFSDIPFTDSYFDSVISVSAIEHSDIDMLPNTVSEINRVWNPTGVGNIILTTSACDGPSNSYDKPTESTLFCENFLLKEFGISSGCLDSIKAVSADYNQSMSWRNTLHNYYKRDFKVFFNNNP